MLSKELQKLIEEIIRKSFNGFRLNLLGPDRINKAFVLSYQGSQYDPNTSLTSAYIHANALNTTDPKSIDEKTIDRLNDVAEKYINQLEEKTIADVLRSVGNSIAEAETKSKISNASLKEILSGEKGFEIIKTLKKELDEIKEKIKKAAELIADHELHTAQNYGAFDGVVAAARSVGIDDPTIIKLGVLDDRRCANCWRLWTLEDKKTPKAYKLSELQANPGHWKNPVASVSPTHPRCRDVIVTIMPGFGFDENGKIVYKGIDKETGKLWDEYSRQRKK